MATVVTARACKVRKRRNSSTSSSSLVLRNHRLKRAIFTGRREVPGTPVPSWKMTSSSTPPIAIAGLQRSHNVTQKAKQGSISARKLAATLWEMHREVSVEGKTNSNKGSDCARDHLPADPSHSAVSDTVNQSGDSGPRRRLGTISHRSKFRGLDSLSNTKPVEVDIPPGGLPPSSFVELKKGLKGTGHCSSSYKELFRILNRIWRLEEQHASSMSLVSVLRAKLKIAHAQIDRLVQEHRFNGDEIESLTKQFTEEKASWKYREQERIKVAVGAIETELEIERKLRNRTDNMYKKLGRELMETKGLLAKTMKQLESERKVRQVMEDVCDELACGVGEDKAEVEELRRESAKVWEEVEKEREMLQLANVWREERVQMKLADAKFELEEKNNVLDKLRMELEAVLKANKASTEEHEEDVFRSAIKDESQQIGRRRQSNCNNNEPDSGEEGSADTELHSIELNKDENSRSYRWSCPAGATEKEGDSDPISHVLAGLKGTSLSYDVKELCGMY